MSGDATRVSPGDRDGFDDLDDWPTGRLLSTAARLVEGAWSARLAERGLTHAGLMAMHELHVHGALPLLDLASGCQVTAQTMTRTVDRLERDGMVVRGRDTRDRRRVRVALTADGEAALAEASDMSAAEPELLGGLVDLAALRANLVAIVEHVGESSRRTLPR